MKPSNEFCINFLKASGWLDNHDKQIKADAIDEITNVLCDELDKGYIFMNKHQIIHFAEQLKEQNNG